MFQPVHYSQCPVCQSAQVAPVLQCTDYTVSQTEFAIWHCQSCSARFTQDGPSAETIGPFYQADSYISHSDTDAGFISKLYKLARRYTLRGKLQLLEKWTADGGHLLDVGAGTGAFLDTMKGAGWNVTGLEPDAGARQVAQKLYNIKLNSADQIYALPDHCFEAITLWHVLEHIHDLHGYMQRFAHMLKPDGTLMIAVPNYTAPDASHYGSAWAAYDVPRHLYHFSPEAMERLAAKHGFVIRQMKPMWLDVFYISLLSEQYRKSSLGLVKACWRGMLSTLATLFNRKKASSLIYIMQLRTS